MRVPISERFPLAYMVDSEQLTVVSYEKDLGVVVHHQLKFHLYTASVASKENRTYGSSPLTSIPLANLIWGPFSLVIRGC